MRPLFFAPALPMNEEWNIRPYFGVFPFVFRALSKKLKIMNYEMITTDRQKVKIEKMISYFYHTYLNSAFSAPRICTVEAGYLARLVSDPA